MKLSITTKWAAVWFLLFYLILIFPFAYFRHDDWFILGNAALRLEGNWKFLFEPMLYHFEDPMTWFFRPLFKLFVYVFYKLYGYEYYFWLSTLLMMVLSTLWASYQCITKLTHSHSLGTLFVVLFCSAVHFHFGSLVWAGEGMMNCPEILCLAFSLLFFLDAFLKTKPFAKWISYILGLIFYIFALGFKEISVAHCGFLIVLFLVEPRLRACSFKKRSLYLFPYFILSVAYLVLRLGMMPLNSHYVGNYTLQLVYNTLMVLMGAFMIPLFSWMVSLRMESKPLVSLYLYGLRRRYLYSLFMIVILLPYVGHAFFSPGWLLFPGFYFCFIICLCASEISKTVSNKQIKHAAFICFVLSVVPVLYRLESLGWWQWHVGQKQIHSIIQTAPASLVKNLRILDCQKKRLPSAHIRKIIGWEGSIYEIWKLTHGIPVNVEIIACDSDLTPLTEDSMILQWEFAHFKLISMPRL